MNKSTEGKPRRFIPFLSNLTPSNAMNEEDIYIEHDRLEKIIFDKDSPNAYNSNAYQNPYKESPNVKIGSRLSRIIINNKPS